MTVAPWRWQLSNSNRYSNSNSNSFRTHHNLTGAVGIRNHRWPRFFDQRSDRPLIVTPFEPEPPYPDRLQSQADADGLSRSPGLHLSQIYRDIEQTIKPKDEWCTEEELAFFGAGGFLWERAFGLCHAKAVATGDIVRPGEFELDGIIGSPDLIHIPSWTLLETKCCWRSVNKFDSALEKNFWAWLVQTKSYCHMIGTDTCELHVFFVCGDWRPPVPQTRSVRIRYGRDELISNWRMIREHAEKKGWL
jgi:hypothetical protein